MGQPENEVSVATDDQCGACGERNPAGSAFCVFCGSYLGWDQAGQGPAAPRGTAPAPAVELRAAGGPRGVPAGESSATRPVGPPPPPAPESPPRPPVTSTTSGSPCPHCGQPNDATRRFCSRCGYPLVTATSTTPAHPRPPGGRGWWDSESRAARREYRQSLPALYRWRRVIVTLGVIAAAVVVLSLTDNHPIEWAREWWRNRTVELVAVEGLSAAADPPGSVPPPYEVAELPDPRQSAWATRWPVDAAEVAPKCGESPADGAIVLTWDEPTRVRGLDVWAGLGKSDGERRLQFLPRQLGVSYDNMCVSRTLDETADRQRLVLDTKAPVKTLRITVDAVYENSAKPQSPFVAIGGLEVLHRPD